jgi:hypothetical protein
MDRKGSLCFLVISLFALGACSSDQSANQAKKAAVPLDKIQGKAQVLEEQGGSADGALNAGGASSVYIWVGVQRYRLFLRKAADIVQGNYYVVEGLNAQKIIDDIGDPDNGKHGYPLAASCDTVIGKIWGGIAMDDAQLDSTALRTVIQRHPARPVFLVAKITAVADDASAADRKKTDDDDKTPSITMPAAKAKAMLVDGPATFPAPLWAADGDTVTCKVTIDTEGKISALDTGKQLCEYAPWAQFHYKPTMQGGKPVKVDTEVEVKYDARK